MQSCEYWQSKIEEYLDNALLGSEKQNFLTHISSCCECQEALELAKAVRLALSDLPDIDVPKDFDERLHAKLAAISTRRHRFITYQRSFAALAACIVLAVAVNAGGLHGFFNEKKSDIISGEQIGIDLSTPTPVYTTGVAASPTPTPTSDNQTGEKVRTTTPTEEKKQTKTAVPTDKATDIAVIHTPTPTAVTTPTPTQEAIQSAEDAEDAVPMTANIMAMDLEETSPPEETAAPVNGARGGGGGGSSAKAKTSDAIGAISVSEENLDAVKAIALTYATPENSVYRMSSQSFDAFLAELEQNGISFSNNVADNEEVCFTIEIL